MAGFSLPPPRQSGPSTGPAHIVRKPTARPKAYSDQQLSAIKSNADVIVVDARAGAGKTTLAVGFADAHPNEQMLYLCFGKANSDEAKERFPKANVDARTINSLAFSCQVGRYGEGELGERTTKRWTTSDVCETLGDGVSYRMCSLTVVVLQAFFNSLKPTITQELITQEMREERGFSDAEVAGALSYAKTVWTRMLTPGLPKVMIPPDACLKAASLDSDAWKVFAKYDRVILDEFQDTNKVTLAFLHQAGQKRRAPLKYLVLGDPHQAIFEFRGTVDAGKYFRSLQGAEVHLLSHTHRFGPLTAAVANAILYRLKGEDAQIVGLGKDHPWQDGPHTFLARTNAALVEEAIARNGKGVHWLGGIDRYGFDNIRDAWQLRYGKVSAVKDRNLKRIGSWDALCDRAEADGDPGLKRIVRMLKTHRQGTVAMLGELERNRQVDPEGAPLILATGHSAKGLDFPFVRLADDFPAVNLVMAERMRQKINGSPATSPLSSKIENEANLLYVAATRARSCLLPDPATADLLRDTMLGPTYGHAMALARDIQVRPRADRASAAEKPRGG